MDSKVWLGLGAISGFFGVALGAFGAHALRETLSEKAMSAYQTAVHYQFIHALALVGLGLWCAQFPSQNAQWAGLGFSIGIVLFSGSLYALALTGIRELGMITPLGGVAFMVGWITFAFLAWKA
jgi:uncharacterized membrane protein YgdD (TMEM256/DUF423 family)